MANRRVSVAYWAEVQLSFVPMTRRRCEAAGVRFNFHPITHHPSWFGPRRSLMVNALHLGKILLAILRSGSGATVCAFGTNASRGLYPFSWMFRRFVCIYNELPEHRAGAPLRWLDHRIFERADAVYVSTTARAEFVSEQYALERAVSVVENIAFETQLEPKSNAREEAIVFAGSITPKRFSSDDVQKFARLVSTLHRPIDVYGFVARELSPQFAALLDHRGHLPHPELLDRLTVYRYALLAYYQGEPNYDLCAPLKLYEYVAAGCTVISINKNLGLARVAAKYPSLLVFADDIGDQPLRREKPSRRAERDEFLREAWQSNERLAVDLMS
jgi:hypothetical protein